MRKYLIPVLWALFLLFILIVDIASAQYVGQLRRVDGRPQEWSGTAWVNIDSDRYENVVVYGALCDSTTDNSAAFLAADAASTASGKSVFIPSCPSGDSYFIGTDTTLNNQVQFANDAIIATTAGVTVRFSTQIRAYDDSKIFDESAGGDVKFNNPAIVWPQWWGAVSTDGGSDRVAFQQAIDSLSASGGTLRIKGTFNMQGTVENAGILTLVDDLDIIGYGPEISKIIVSSNTTNYRAIFGEFGTTHNNITISDIEFDHNSANVALTTAQLSVSARASAYFYGGQNINFVNNRVINSNGRQCIYINDAEASNVHITGNTFYNIGDNTEDYAYDSSCIYVRSLYGTIISDNTITNPTKSNALNEGGITAIETHGGDMVVSGNQIYNFALGMNITGISPDVDDDARIVVSNNSINTINYGIQLWSQTTGSHTTGYGLRNSIISGNAITIDYSDGLSTFVGTNIRGIAFQSVISLDLKNITVSDNTIEFIQDDGTAGIANTTLAIGNEGSSDTTLGFVDSLFSNNTIINSPGTAFRFAGDVDNVVVKDNLVINPGSSLNVGVTNNFRNFLLVFASSGVSGDLYVENNHVIDKQDTSTIKNFVYLYCASDAGGDIIFKRNRLDLQGTTTTGFLTHYEHAFPEACEIFVDDEHPDFKVPVDDLQGYSQNFDQDNNIKHYLLADGAAWRSETWAASVPVAGAYTFGSIVWNTTPSATDCLGWINTVAGSPGTFRCIDFADYDNFVGDIIPGADNTYTLGSGTNRWASLYVFTLYINRLSSSIIPTVNNAYYIGTTSNRISYGNFSQYVRTAEGFMWEPIVVNVASYNTANDTAFYLVDYTTTGAVTIDIQTADIVDGSAFIIKDSGGNAGSNNITVTTQGSETIDGGASIAITVNYGYVELRSDGTNLFITNQKL